MESHFILWQGYVYPSVVCLTNLDNGGNADLRSWFETNAMCLVLDTSRFKRQASSQKLAHFSLLLAKVALGSSLLLVVSVLPDPAHQPPWSQLIDQGKGSDPWIFACCLVSGT